MNTVPCPQGDKGICTIPDSTVVAIEGKLSVASREEVERRFPDLELEETNLKPFDFEGSHEDLLEAAGGESTGDAEVESHRDLFRPLLAMGANVVIVTCSCGHTYGTGAR